MVLPSFLSLFLLLNVALRETKAVRYAPEVTLKSGKIRGLLDDLNTGGTVRKYVGIPFAKAQRFQAPTDPDPWAGIKDTISSGKICPQQPNTQEKFSDMTEDCLNLNVFVPHGAGSSLPVMVWIHGGAFAVGSNKLYDGSYIATLGNVIVVVINYRLSTFGFLASGKDGLTGNYGMLDQVHALKWVKNNIQSFGGDPNKVTIFGVSAGGASVGLLVLSPMTKGLFQRAILQSGDVNAFWAYKTYSEALGIAKMVAKGNGCPNVQSLGDCLKDKSFEEVVKATKNILARGGTVFNPVVDGCDGFLPDSPDVLLKSGKFNDVDIIIGFTDDEGVVMTNAVPLGLKGTIDVKNGLSRSRFTTLVHNSRFVHGQTRVINEAVLYLYTNWNNITDPYSNRRMYIDMATDAYFIAPAVKSAKAIAKKTSKIYMYQLQYRFDTIFNKPIPSWVRAYHGADLPILFGQPFLIAALTKSSVYTKDGNFSRAIITMWTNFAKSGDPNTPEPISLAWPKYDVNQQKFMALKPMFAVQEKPHNSHVAFWNEFVPAALRATPKPTPAPCDDSCTRAMARAKLNLAMLKKALNKCWDANRHW